LNKLWQGKLVAKVADAALDEVLADSCDSQNTEEAPALRTIHKCGTHSYLRIKCIKSPFPDIKSLGYLISERTH